MNYNYKVTSSNGIQIPIKLTPGGSLYVVFNNQYASQEHITEVTKDGAACVATIGNKNGLTASLRNNGDYNFTLNSGKTIDKKVNNIPYPILMI